MTVEPPDLPPEPFDPHDYSAAVDAINKPNEQLRRDARRTRLLVRGAWVGLVAAFAAIAVSVIAFFQAVAIAHGARVAACHQANQFRAGDLKLWTRVLSYPPSAPRTPAAEATVADFKKFLAVHDQPVDCSKVR